MSVSYSNLLAVLNTSRALKANDGAYQTIKQLLQTLDTNQTTTNNQLTVNTNGLDGPIVTYDKDSNLANSRELIAGTNITFDESIGQELKISASGGGGTTIVSPIPAFIFDTDADEGFPIPGPPGISGSTGPQGIQGLSGISVLNFDGDNGEDSLIPGPSGLNGTNGLSGNVPIIVTSNTTINTSTCWIVSESLEISSGVILEIGSGARLEITGKVNSSADYIGSGNPQGVLYGYGGQTYRDFTNGIKYTKLSNSYSNTGWYRSDYSLYNAQAFSLAANPSTAASILNVNIPITTANGNGNFSGSLLVRQPIGPLQALTTGLTTAVGASIVSQVGDVGGQSNFDITWLIQTDPSDISAHIRYFFGVSNTNTVVNLDTLTVDGALFRYSTTASDAGWVFVTFDGTQAVSSVINSITANTVYNLRMRYFWNGTGTIYVSINDGAETVVKSHVPLNQNFSIQSVIGNPDGGGGAGTNRQLGFYRCWGWLGINS